MKAHAKKCSECETGRGWRCEFGFSSGRKCSNFRPRTDAKPAAAQAKPQARAGQ